MRKKMNTRRMISVLLLLCMILSNSATAFAAYSHPTENFTQIDRLTTEYYDIALYQDENMVYAITTLSDGRIELAFAEIGGSARNLWINSNDLGYEVPLNYTATSTMPLDNTNFVESVISFGKNNVEKSKLVNVEYIEPDSESKPQPTASDTGTDDYLALISQLKALHGKEYQDKHWNPDTIYKGDTYNFRENLDYDMIYRDKFWFTATTTLGGLAISIAQVNPAWAPPLSVLAIVLGVLASTDVLLDHAGAISSYYGSATYCRYVLVNNKRAYYQCFKTTNYSGWVEEGYNDSATLEELDTFYNPNIDTFLSPTIQRDYAYQAYN